MDKDCKNCQLPDCEECEGNQITGKEPDIFRPHHHRHHHGYEPFYDNSADYNTNAKSYYDFLARWKMAQKTIVNSINRLLRRNLKVSDTESVNFVKKGDWIDNGDCCNYDDIIELKANVIISKQIVPYTFVHLQIKQFEIPNGTSIKSDGVWSPDYLSVLQQIDKEIGDNNENITNITNAMQKIIDNLYQSGAITNNTFNFDFNAGRNFATGNINLYGQKGGSEHFIKTRNNVGNYDITAGSKE